MKLWFDKPAKRWEEAMPISNGTLGGMVFGSADIDRIQLNEDSLWYGGPMNRNNPDALSHLARLRELVFEGKISEAEELASKVLIGVPDGQRHYEPLGDLYMVRNDSELHVEAYRRELNLEHAIASVRYSSGNVEYLREYFSSYPDQVTVIRQSASMSGRISFTALFGRGAVLEPTPWSDILKHPVGFQAYLDRIEFSAQGDMIIRGRSGGEEGVRFCCAIRIVSEGGRLSLKGRQLSVEQADMATLLLSACTDFRFSPEEMEAECIRRIDLASAKSYEQLRTDHTSDYRYLFNRVDLFLQGSEDSAALTKLATDQRLERVRAGSDDLGLVSLYFHFGRYLLISSSRPGSLPANL